MSNPTAWQIVNDGRAFSAWVLDEEYEAPESPADDTLPGTYPAESAADNVEETIAEGADAAAYAWDLSPADDVVPDWTKYAVAGIVLIVLLIALRPYASLAEGVAG